MKKTFNKIMKKIPETGLLMIICVILVCILIYAIILRINAEDTGSKLGQTTGEQIGKFVGSFEALTDYGKAYAEGKEQGLSAEDTTAEIANQIKSISKLEVLVASVKLSDIHTIGEEKNCDYAALYLGKGEAVFTVNLNKAEIVDDGEEILITLPKPEMELIVNQSEIKKVAEYQKRFFSGSSEDGFDAYLNSMSKLVGESEKTLANYDVLVATAQEAAIKQITQLASSVSVGEREIVINFEEGR